MSLRKGQFIIITLLLLLLCDSIVFSNTSKKFYTNEPVESFVSLQIQGVPEHITLADLIEIEYMAINGNDELLQMAEDNNWPGTGFEWDPIIIEGYYFKSAVHHFVVDNTDLYWEFRNNVLDGIDDRYCEIVIGNLRNGKISNNYFVRGSVGVHGIRISDCIITGNEFYNQSWDGVLFEYSYSNIIIGNTFIDEGEAGVLGWVDSDNNNVMYNEVYGSRYGFMFWDGSDENTVQHNSIHDISYRGIDIQTEDNIIKNNEIYNIDGDAISVSEPGMEIRGNLIYHGLGYGITLYSGSGDAIIENNIVIGFETGGINLHESDNSYIARNDFYDNSRIQAWDYGDNNIFTENYWHEWIANDTDENGILDSPKLISGGDNMDSRPCSSPVNPIPSWYDFEPITGPPPVPEPTETTSTTDSNTITNLITSTTTTTDANQIVANDLLIPILSIGVGIGAALSIIVFVMKQRTEL